MRDIKLRVLFNIFLFAIVLVFFAKCKKDPTNNTQNSTYDFNGEWVCYNIDDFDKSYNWELYCRDSANAPYLDSGGEDFHEHTLNINQESMKWFLEIFASSYSNNRPDTCGGPYSFKDTIIQDHTFKILKVEGNRIITEFDDGQTKSQIDYLYEMFGTEELRIYIVNPGETEGVGPFTYKRK